MKSPIKSPTGSATISPADFPLGSPASRAVARALLRLRRPPAYVVETDDKDRPILEADRRYGGVIVLAPRKLTAEEWAKKYAHTPEPDKEKP